MAGGCTFNLDRLGVVDQQRVPPKLTGPLAPTIWPWRAPALPSDRGVRGCSYLFLGPGPVLKIRTERATPPSQGVLGGAVRAKAICGASAPEQHVRRGIAARCVGEEAVSTTGRHNAGLGGAAHVCRSKRARVHEVCPRCGRALRAAMGPTMWGGPPDFGDVGPHVVSPPRARRGYPHRRGAGAENAQSRRARVAWDRSRQPAGCGAIGSPSEPTPGHEQDLHLGPKGSASFRVGGK